MFSCNRKDVECSPKRYDCEIELIDKYGVSQIGVDKIYKPDSITMIINNTKWTTYIEVDKIVWNYAGLDYLNYTKYYLYLSSLDTDTLDFIISSKSGECFNTYKIDTFIYNNKIIIPDTSEYQERLIYKIIKQ
jgi:hypothetical protein